MMDWTDADVAMFNLGVALGLWPSVEDSPMEFSVARKGTVNSNNPLGNGLYDSLRNLVAAGVLEGEVDSEDPDAAPQRFRWCYRDDRT
jgi:hypothetical protein